MKTLARETAEKLNTTQISSVNSRPAAKTCYSCDGYGHLSRQCPTMNNFGHKNNVYAQGQEKLCYSCQKPGHLARSCPLANPPPLVNSLPQWPPAQGLINKNSQMNRQSTVCYKCGNFIWAYCKILYCEPKLWGHTTGKETGNANQKDKSGSKIRLSTVSSADEKKTLMVETIINGKPKLCVVDTGASHWYLGQDNFKCSTR